MHSAAFPPSSVAPPSRLGRQLPHLASHLDRQAAHRRLHGAGRQQGQWQRRCDAVVAAAAAAAGAAGAAAPPTATAASLAAPLPFFPDRRVRWGWL